MTEQILEFARWSQSVFASSSSPRPVEVYRDAQHFVRALAMAFLRPGDAQAWRALCALQLDSLKALLGVQQRANPGALNSPGIAIEMCTETLFALVIRSRFTEAGEWESLAGSLGECLWLGASTVTFSSAPSTVILGKWGEACLCLTRNVLSQKFQALSHQSSTGGSGGSSGDSFMAWDVLPWTHHHAFALWHQMIALPGHPLDLQEHLGGNSQAALTLLVRHVNTLGLVQREVLRLATDYASTSNSSATANGLPCLYALLPWFLDLASPQNSPRHASSSTFSIEHLCRYGSGDCQDNGIRSSLCHRPGPAPDSRNLAPKWVSSPLLLPPSPLLFCHPWRSNPRQP